MSQPESHVDLIVIGGGVLGTFHAYHALQRGMRVVLIERDARPREATVRNFGQVVPSGLDSQWQAFGRDSLRIYKAIQEQFDISVRQLGSVYMASDDEETALLEELHQINQQSDYPSEMLSASECARRYPNLRSDYCKAGLFFPEEISVGPSLMIHQLHSFLNSQENLTAHFGTCVCEIEEAGSSRVVVRTTDGRSFSADKVIVCSGSEFRILYPELFRTSDLTLVQLQMMRLAAQPNVRLDGNILTGLSIRRYESFAECPSWSEIKSREPSDSFERQWGIHILFKQEVDGAIILGDSHQYAPASAPEQLPFAAHTPVNAFMLDEAKRIANLSSWNVESTWCGRYCQTSDPAGIMRLSVGSNVHIVTGIGGKGMTSSAGYARHHIGEIWND